MNLKKSNEKTIYAKSEYDNIASKYDILFNIISLGQIQKIKKISLEKIKPGENILEVGCGTGWLCCQCAKKGANVIALDISNKMLDLAKERAKKCLLDKNIKFINLDLINEDLSNIKKILSFRFDKIIFCYILDIFPDENIVCRMINNANKFLKNSGEIIIIDELIPKNPVAKKFVNIFRFPVFKYLEKTTNMRYHKIHDFTSILHKLDYKNIETELMPLNYLGILTVKKISN